MTGWQRNGTALCVRFLTVALFLFSVELAAFTLSSDSKLSSPPNMSADELVRQVVANETQLVDSDHSHWMYRQHHVEDGKDTLKECVDTDQGALCRLIAEGGHPLSQSEQAKEKERLAELVKNPERQRKLQEARKKDGDQALKMLKMLPNAIQASGAPIQ